MEIAHLFVTAQIIKANVHDQSSDCRTKHKIKAVNKYLKNETK